ncbi:MAG: DUF5667 domain-containing protein [Anaerolineae bacterium]
MLSKRAEQFEEFLQRAEQGETIEGPWAGLVQTGQELSRLAVEAPPPPGRLRAGRQRFLTEAARQRETKHARNKRRLVPMMGKMRWVGVMVAALLFFTAVSGTGYALADNSLPGGALYGLKGAMEQVRVNLTRSPEAKAELAIDLAEERLEEIATMLQKGQAVDQGVVNQAKGQLVAAEHAVANAGESEGPMRARMGNMVLARVGQLQDKGQRIGAPIADDTEAEAVDELVQYMQQRVHRVQVPSVEVDQPGQAQTQNQAQGENAQAAQGENAQGDPGPAGEYHYYYWGADYGQDGHFAGEAPSYGPGPGDEAEPPYGDDAPYGTQGDDTQNQYGPGGTDDDGKSKPSSGQKNSSGETQNGSGGSGGSGGH